MAYRLIWFQHFHKAAGSAVVEAAASNGETFWPNHLNGNPTDEDGNQISLWNYDDAALSEFVDQCEANGVTFVATEWGLPNLNILGSDQRVFLITCLRDPLARYVSNFYYDLHNGYTAARSLSGFKNTRQRLFTMDNYYCRILARMDNSTMAVDERVYDSAKRSLECFDWVGFTDARLVQLQDALSWRQELGSANVNQIRARELFALLLRLRWRLLYLRLRHPKTGPDPAFAEEFKAANAWDYRLLQWASAKKWDGAPAQS